MSGLQARRDPALAEFLAALETAVMADAPPASGVPASRARDAAARVFARCRDRAGRAEPPAPVSSPVSSPVLAVLPAALALDRPPSRGRVAAAVAALAPRLGWAPRASATDPAFRDAHANAMLVGPGGIEARDDVWIGLTLMAPHVAYPEHSHAPEEVYLALTPGEWWNARMDWTDPGPEGLIHNPPGIAHAMRSGATPFLAVWLLPV